MISISKSRKGFTIIELVIIISVIALLSTVVLTALRPIQKRGRDTRRLADLRSIQNSLELYYAKFSYYPDTLDGLLAEGTGITKIPADPLYKEAGDSKQYDYNVCVSKQGYDLHALLETDPPDTLYNDASDATCGGSCNYETARDYCVSP